jgi:hypothetical protein
MPRKRPKKTIAYDHTADKIYTYAHTVAAALIESVPVVMARVDNMSRSAARCELDRYNAYIEVIESVIGSMQGGTELDIWQCAQREVERGTNDE